MRRCGRGLGGVECIAKLGEGAVDRAGQGGMCDVGRAVAGEVEVELAFGERREDGGRQLLREQGRGARGAELEVASRPGEMSKKGSDRPPGWGADAARHSAGCAGGIYE